MGIPSSDLPVFVRAKLTGKTNTGVPVYRVSAKIDEMAASLSVDFPGMRLVNPTNNRQQWRVVAARSRSQRLTVYLQLLSLGLPALPVVVTITRIGRGTMDDDSLRPAAKAVRDSVADAYGIKDNDERIKFEYQQEKGQYAARVDIRKIK